MPNYITLSEPANPAQPRHVAYYEFGNRDNPNKIICLHGLSRNGLDFESLAGDLANYYHVICPDMAGRGKSDWLTHKMDYNYSTYISDIEELSAALSLVQVDWIGTSMGGIVGMMLAAQKPAFIKRLVLNDCGAIVSAQGLKRIAGYLGRETIFPDKDGAMDYIKTTYACFGLSLEEHWRQLFQSSFIPLKDGRYALAYDPEISAPFHQVNDQQERVDIDLSAAWNQVKCPTLILRGEASDLLSHATAVSMSENKPQTTLVEFSGIGHAPALLDRSQITTVTDWLKQTAEGCVIPYS